MIRAPDRDANVGGTQNRAGIGIDQGFVDADLGKPVGLRDGNDAPRRAPAKHCAHNQATPARPPAAATSAMVGASKPMIQLRPLRPDRSRSLKTRPTSPG